VVEKLLDRLVQLVALAAHAHGRIVAVPRDPRKFSGRHGLEPRECSRLTAGSHACFRLNARRVARLPRRVCSTAAP
jgi:hypothetical protein